MIVDTLKEIQDDFSLLDEMDDRYQYLIDLGKQLVDLPSEFKVDEFKIRGCQSSVWLVHHIIDGKLYFNASSDAFIVRGIVSLLLRLFSNRTPKEILTVDAENIMEAMGLTSHLSPGRQNGLWKMIERIHLLANENL